MRNYRNILFGVILIIIVPLLCCLGAPTAGDVLNNMFYPKPGIPVVPATEPGQTYYRLAWLDDDWLVAEQDNGAHTLFSTGLVLIKIDGSKMQAVPLADVSECASDRYSSLSPDRISNGKLGFLMKCTDASGSGAILTYVMVYDPATNKSSQLLSYPIGNGAPTGRISWKQDMTEAVSGNGSNRWFSEQLVRYTSDGMEPIDTGLGQAFDATWSPDGTQIAFVGSENVDTIQQTSPYSIYLISPDDPGHPREVIGGFSGVTSMDWSPDGKWLVFEGGNRQRIGSDFGLWLLEVATERLVLIGRSKQRFRYPSWSPDSKRIAYILYEDNFSLINFIIGIRDVSQIFILELEDVSGAKVP